MSKQNKAQELDHARKILHNPERFWNEETLAGRKGSLRRAEWIVRAARMGPAKRVLEVGCGTGFFSEIFSRTGAALRAIDISSELLEKARSRGLSGVEFRVSDIEHLPWADGFFDAAVGVRVLHHLDMEAAFREIVRVLKPGGRIAFCEPNMLNPQIMIQKNIPFIKRRMGDTPGETAFFRWGMGRFLAARGFTDIEIVPFDFLHPWTPAPLTGFVEKAGAAAERIPLLREIGGSLKISAIFAGVTPVH